MGLGLGLAWYVAESAGPAPKAGADADQAETAVLGMP
jgi:hypothetical protein